MKHCIVPIDPEDLRLLLQMPEGARITGCEYNLKSDRILLAVQGFGLERLRGTAPIAITPSISRINGHDTIEWDAP